MQSVVPLKLDTLWQGLGDLTENFNSEIITDDNRNSIKNLNLNYSYEFLLADYFSNSTNYTNSLKSVLHLFLKRWFQELFKDNREMILFNVLNKNFQTALNFTENDLNLNSVNPISAIPSLKYYADEAIWIQENILSNNFQICNLNNLNQTQIDGIRNLFKKIFNEIEGIDIDQSVFQVLNFLEYACKESITTDELNNVLNFVIENPFDTCLVPKFDFQNINYVFLHNLLNLKRDNNIEAINKFRLL